jgi:1-deoxy-D-xylulose-5-phosphate reductoisomerase
LRSTFVNLRVFKNYILEFKRRNIAILGSTGSIGTQTLDVVKEHSDKFEVELLTANNNSALLIEQAIAFKPNTVVIANESKYDEVFNALDSLDIKVYAGHEAIADVVQMESIDIVLTAMVGYAGLRSTIKAIEAGKHIALANKETLVVAGEIITALAEKHKVGIIPVDSEHSAIFQCLVGEFHNKLEKIILTASGGPFRAKSIDYLKNVTKEQALKHPNWDMGAKITIDSSTMMNKGLEVIEAKWLFELTPDKIEVVIHPQSIIHSMVQFEDGSIKAQMGLPDMKLPIQYALAYPQRLKSSFPRFSFMDYPSLDFEAPDLEKFRNLDLAYQALNKGGNQACVLNAANEIAVDAFLKDKIEYLKIPDLIEGCMQKVAFLEKPSYDDYVQTDQETRLLATTMI